MSKTDVALGVASIVISLAVWVATEGYPYPADISRGLSPAAFPRFLAAIMGIFGAVILWRGIRIPRKETGPPPLKMPAVFLGLVGVYTAIIVPLGFILSTPLFLMAMTIVLGVKARWALAFSVSTTVVTFVVFRTLLKVPLPPGQLF